MAARNEGFPADFPTGGPELSAVLARGQERFNIYCAVCHGYNGQGTGMIVQRGFTKPPAFVVLDEDKVTNPPRYEREQWLQTAVAGTIWLVVPLTIGLVTMMRSEVK